MSQSRAVAACAVKPLQCCWSGDWGSARGSCMRRGAASNLAERGVARLIGRQQPGHVGKKKHRRWLSPSAKKERKKLQSLFQILEITISRDDTVDHKMVQIRKQ